MLNTIVWVNINSLVTEIFLVINILNISPEKSSPDTCQKSILDYDDKSILVHVNSGGLVL